MDHTPYEQGAGYFASTVGIFVITIALNVDWKHYIRYWDGFFGLSIQRWARRIRVLFLLAFLASVWDLIRVLSAVHLTEDFLQSALPNFLIGLGIFVAVDLFFRWRWGRPN
jgi:hypothetical protein